MYLNISSHFAVHLKLVHCKSTILQVFKKWVLCSCNMNSEVLQVTTVELFKFSFYCLFILKVIENGVIKSLTVIMSFHISPFCLINFCFL